MNLLAGVRIEYMPYYMIISPDNINSGTTWSWRNYYHYVYMRFTYDNENTRYFPDRGLRVTASYDYDFFNTHYVAAGIHGVIPVCKFFSIIASANGRYKFGDSDHNTYMNNYVGSIMPGRYYEQQIPFVGYNAVSGRKELLTVANLELRFKFAKKYYLSAIGAAMHDGSSLEDMKSQHAVYAAGLQFSYKSKFGPLLANLHWNSAFNKVGFYVSAGYDF